MSKTRGSPIWKGPTRSLQPLDLVSHIRDTAIVRLIVGEKDDVVFPDVSVAYAGALKKRSVNATVTIVPSLGHNILLTKPVLDALANLLQR